MKKEIEYEIEYMQKGKVKSINVSIKFASQMIVEKYGKYLDLMRAFSKLRQEHQVAFENEASNLVEPGLSITDRREKARELKSIREEKEKELLDLGSTKMLTDRWKILNRFLEDNLDEDDYTHDEYSMLLSESFWNEKVNPKLTNTFMNECILKDILKDLKKKQ